MSISRSIAWSAWLIVSIFYAYQYILRVMPNIMLPEIMAQFNIDAALFGQFSGAYYLGYCFLHLPVGIMLDRFGPRKVMTACILLTVIGMLPILFTNYWVFPIIGRFLIGVGSSAAILGIFKIVRMIFQEKHFTRMLSFSVTIGLLGAIYGGGPVAYLCQAYGHKYVVAGSAVIGIIFALFTYMLVPEMEKANKTTVLSDMKMVFTNPKVMFFCVLSGLMVGPMEGFADAWGSEFLKRVYGFDASSASYLTSMMYIGMCFTPILSYIAEKTDSYLGTITISGIIMFFVFALLIAGMLNFQTITIAFFIVGLCSSYQVLAIYKASTYSPDNVAGLTTAVANMIIMSFGYIFHSTIGIIIKASSSYGDVMSYKYGIAFIPATLLIGVIGFFAIYLQESGSKKIEETQSV